MSITIRQIAEKAGVSRGTVDRVLNNRGNVSPEVQEKILAICREENFKPNLIARGLAVRKGEPKKIGVLVNSVDNPFFIDVFDGIWDYAAQIADFGIRVELRTAKGYDVLRQLELLDGLVADNISALIITPINEDIVAKKLNAIIAEGVPVVALNTDVLSVNRLAYVGCDYEKSGCTAAGILGMMSAGQPQKVGIITGSIKVLGHNLRIKGFSRVLRRDFGNIQIADIVQNNDSDDASYQKVRELFRVYPDLTALYFTAAGTAGGLKAVEELGLAGKVHIICFDLTPSVKKFLKKGVISVAICQEPYQQGSLSMKFVFNKLMMNAIPEKEVNYTELSIKTKYNI